MISKRQAKNRKILKLIYGINILIELFFSLGIIGNIELGVDVPTYGIKILIINTIILLINTYIIKNIKL